MTNPNQDTDPSTPGAKRHSDPRTPVTGAVTGAVGDPSAQGGRVRPTSTDPGVAPPGPMLPVPDEPMGIVVPSSAAQRLNDSVDVLLEGISREFPDRPYPASQSDGRSTATYHAGHPVRAGVGTPPSDEPKVLALASFLLARIG